jgi:hypothetical protein
MVQFLSFVSEKFSIQSNFYAWITSFLSFFYDVCRLQIGNLEQFKCLFKLITHDFQIIIEVNKTFCELKNSLSLIISLYHAQNAAYTRLKESILINLHSRLPAM